MGAAAQAQIHPGAGFRRAGNQDASGLLAGIDGVVPCDGIREDRGGRCGGVNADGAGSRRASVTGGIGGGGADVAACRNFGTQEIRSPGAGGGVGGDGLGGKAPGDIHAGAGLGGTRNRDPGRLLGKVDHVVTGHGADGGKAGGGGVHYEAAGGADRALIAAAAFHHSGEAVATGGEGAGGEGPGVAGQIGGCGPQTGGTVIDDDLVADRQSAGDAAGQGRGCIVGDAGGGDAPQDGRYIVDDVGDGHGGAGHGGVHRHCVGIAGTHALIAGRIFHARGEAVGGVGQARGGEGPGAAGGATADGGGAQAGATVVDHQHFAGSGNAGQGAGQAQCVVVGAAAAGDVAQGRGHVVVGAGDDDSAGRRGGVHCQCAKAEGRTRVARDVDLAYLHLAGAVAAGGQGEAAAAAGAPGAAVVGAVLPGGAAFQARYIHLTVAGDAIRGAGAGVRLQVRDGRLGGCRVHGDGAGADGGGGIAGLVREGGGKDVVAVSQGAGESDVHVAVADVGGRQGERTQGGAIVQQGELVAGYGGGSVRGGGVEADAGGGGLEVGDAVATGAATVGAGGEALHRGRSRGDPVYVLGLGGGNLAHGGGVANGCAGVGDVALDCAVGHARRVQNAAQGAGVGQGQGCAGAGGTLDLAGQAGDGVGFAAPVVFGQGSNGGHLSGGFLGLDVTAGEGVVGKQCPARGQAGQAQLGGHGIRGAGGADTGGGHHRLHQGGQGVDGGGAGGGLQVQGIGDAGVDIHATPGDDGAGGGAGGQEEVTVGVGSDAGVVQNAGGRLYIDGGAAYIAVGNDPAGEGGGVVAGQVLNGGSLVACGIRVGERYGIDGPEGRAQGQGQGAAADRSTGNGIWRAAGADREGIQGGKVAAVQRGVIHQIDAAGAAVGRHGLNDWRNRVDDHDPCTGQDAGVTGRVRRRCADAAAGTICGNFPRQVTDRPGARAAGNGGMQHSAPIDGDRGAGFRRAGYRHPGGFLGGIDDVVRGDGADDRRGGGRGVRSGAAAAAASAAATTATRRRSEAKPGENHQAGAGAGRSDRSGTGIAGSAGACRIGWGFTGRACRGRAGVRQDHGRTALVLDQKFGGGATAFLLEDGQILGIHRLAEVLSAFPVPDPMHCCGLRCAGANHRLDWCLGRERLLLGGGQEGGLGVRGGELLIHVYLQNFCVGCYAGAAPHLWPQECSTACEAAPI